MRPYRIELERGMAFDIERRHSKLGEATQFRDPEIKRLIDEDWKRIEEAPDTAVRKLHQEVSELTIAQCAWKAITWGPPDKKPSR